GLLPGELLPAADLYVDVARIQLGHVGRALGLLGADHGAARAAEHVEHDLALLGAVQDGAAGEFHGLHRRVHGGAGAAVAVVAAHLPDVVGLAARGAEQHALAGLEVHVAHLSALGHLRAHVELLAVGHGEDDPRANGRVGLACGRARVDAPHGGLGPGPVE